MGQNKETIRLEHLSIGYAGKKGPHIVGENIQASLKSGELTCLLGANGAGKSTLLRTISAFQPILSGNIFLGNRKLNTFTLAELATQISVVLTDRLDINGMTVYELVSLGRTPYTDYWGKLEDNDKAIIERSLSLVGITELSRRPLQTLSDGERQKTMIAKALAQETPIILLDEPTAFLDYPSKVEVLQLLRRLSKETNKSILLSTHDLEMALQIADKIWLMHRSKEMISGTPEDLSLNGKFKNFFKSKGVTFDDETGLYRISNSIDHHIQIIGQGDRYNMVCKALLRNGIKGDNTPSDISINITDTTYEVNDKDHKLYATSIEDLLTILNELW